MSGVSVTRDTFRMIAACARGPGRLARGRRVGSLAWTYEHPGRREDGGRARLDHRDRARRGAGGGGGRPTRSRRGSGPGTQTAPRSSRSSPRRAATARSASAAPSPSRSTAVTSPPGRRRRLSSTPGPGALGVVSGVALDPDDLDRAAVACHGDRRRDDGYQRASGGLTPSQRASATPTTAAATSASAPATTLPQARRRARRASAGALGRPRRPVRPGGDRAAARGAPARLVGREQAAVHEHLVLGLLGVRLGVPEGVEHPLRFRQVDHVLGSSHARDQPCPGDVGDPPRLPYLRIMLDRVSEIADQSVPRSKHWKSPAFRAVSVPQSQ